MYFKFLFILMPAFSDSILTKKELADHIKRDKRLADLNESLNQLERSKAKLPKEMSDDLTRMEKQFFLRLSKELESMNTPKQSVTIPNNAFTQELEKSKEDFIKRLSTELESVERPNLKTKSENYRSKDKEIKSLSKDDNSNPTIKLPKEVLLDIPKAENNITINSTKTRKEIEMSLNSKLSVTHKGNSIEFNETKELNIYLDYIKTKGVKRLKTIEKQIIERLNIDKKLCDSSNHDSYAIKIQKYFDDILNLAKDYYGDIILLDLAEIANRLLYHEQRKILNETIAKLKNYDTAVDYQYSIEFNDGKISSQLKRDIKNLVNDIITDSTQLRIDEMNNICTKYGTCRPYPAFSDQCGYFISEILKLPKKKFEIFAKVFSMAMGLNEDFAAVIARVQNNRNLPINIVKATNNITKVKDTLQTLQEILSQKFYIILNPKLELKSRALAIRLLLDNIDKLYINENYDKIVNDFNVVISSLKDWAVDKISAISMVTANFIGKLLKDLNKITLSNENEMKRIMILMEIIQSRDSSKHEKYYKLMFENNFTGGKRNSNLDHLNFL